MASGVLTRPAAFFATLWLATPLCSCVSLYLHVLSGGHLATTPRYVSFVLEFAVWVPLVPLMVWLVRRIAALPGGRATAVVAHVLAFTLLVSLTHLVCLIIIGAAVAGYAHFLVLLGNGTLFFRGLCFSVFIYTATVCGVRLLDLLAAARERELRAARAERELASAEVQIVSGQLHPDYLTGIFRWVIAHLRGEPAAAERMIHRLADFLRLNLYAISTHNLTLRDDVALVTSWARVESLRTGRTIEVENLIEQRWLALPIAGPLIHPLVEKAARSGTGNIRLATTRASHSLEVSVSIGEELHWVMLPAGER